MPAFNLTSCTSGAHLLRPSNLISGTCRQIRSRYVAQTSGATPWIAAWVRRYPDIKSYGTLAGGISCQFPLPAYVLPQSITPQFLISHVIISWGLALMACSRTMHFQPHRRVYARPSPLPTQIGSHLVWYRYHILTESTVLTKLVLSMINNC